jgi:hypothetical protein
MEEEVSNSLGLLLSDDDLSEDDSYVVEELSGPVENSSEIEIPGNASGNFCKLACFEF